MIRIAGWLAGANAVSLALSFVQSIVLARWLGVERSGHLAYFLGFVTLADTAAQGGLGRIITREVAARPRRDGAVMGAALAAQAALIAVAGAAVMFLAGRWAALLLVGSLGSAGVFVLQGKRLRGSQVAAGLAGSTTSFAAVMIAFAWMHPSVRKALAILAFAGLIRGCAQLLLARRALVRPLALDREGVAMLMRDAWPLWLNAVVVAGYYRLDVILIRWLLPVETAVRQLSWYRAAYGLTEGGNVILGALAVSAFPLFANRR
ncbi:MAG: oligosaccharide flippase family protein, partial [bacterium]